MLRLRQVLFPLLVDKRGIRFYTQSARDADLSPLFKMKHVPVHSVFRFQSRDVSHLFLCHPIFLFYRLNHCLNKGFFFFRPLSRCEFLRIVWNVDEKT